MHFLRVGFVWTDSGSPAAKTLEKYMNTITVYEVRATFEKDGQYQDCSQAEVIGDAFGEYYFSESEAEEVAGDLQCDLENTDLDPSTEYSVHEKSMSVEVTITDVDPDVPGDAFSHYVCLDVQMGNATDIHTAGCMIGAPESLHGTIKEAGCGVKPQCTAWWSDPVDWQDLPPGSADLVLGVLSKESWRLFLEAENFQED
jgi:hypothetical protein